MLSQSIIVLPRTDRYPIQAKAPIQEKRGPDRHRSRRLIEGLPRIMNEPWSKRHKADFKGCKYSLSNSFAEPLSHAELVKYTKDEELLRLYKEHDLTYVPNGGSMDLRQDIARVMYDSKLSAENILVFPGGQVAIQTASLAFASGCHSIVFIPGYQSTVESPGWALHNEGITKIERRPENDWQIDTKLLRAAIRENTKYMIINEPHNPGGIVMPKELQQDVIEICRENGIAILCDEVYRLLEHNPSETIPAMANAYERGISCVTMSKPWGGCGISIGWLACSDSSMIQKLVDDLHFGTACCSRASEIQGRMVLAASDAILEDRRNIILKNKALLQDFIENKYPEWFRWRRPNAGAIAFLEFKGPLTSEQLGDCLREASISIKPTYCFVDDITSALESYFRVGFGEAKFHLALEALDKFVQANESAWRDSNPK
ncbi:hypothetical protein ACHAXN_010096 [Cyclotella atomus]